MCQIWLRSDGRVEKKGGVQTQTDKGKLQLYIVDLYYVVWYFYNYLFRSVLLLEIKLLLLLNVDNNGRE